MAEVKKTKWYRKWKVWAGVFGALFIIGLFTPDNEAIETIEADIVAVSDEQKADEKAKKKAEELKKAQEDAEIEAEVMEAVKKKEAAKDKSKEKAKEEESEKATVSREEVNSALYGIAEASEGTLSNVYVTPYAPEGILTQISVDVSDAWYYTQEFEKERFAEVVYDAIKAKLVEVGAIENYDETIIVTLYDGHGKELAKSKMLGGFKIKR